MPDSTRWTDQDVPLDELQTGNVNTDSLIILEKMRALFRNADSLIEGRPASFYLDRADISQTGKSFYLLHFIPSDNEETYALCDSLLSKNDSTRPFYYFLFLRMHRIADGALKEGMAGFATQYSLLFVEEFYRCLQLPANRSSYSFWVRDFALTTLSMRSSSASSTSMTPAQLRQYIITNQIKNAKQITPGLREKINIFADSVVSIYRDNL